MKQINDDVTILGKLIVTELGGEPIDRLRRELDENQTALAEALRAELKTKATAEELNELKDRYNKAIEVINNLSERIAALESNYDPTVIS